MREKGENVTKSRKGRRKETAKKLLYKKISSKTNLIQRKRQTHKKNNVDKDALAQYIVNLKKPKMQQKLKTIVKETLHLKIMIYNDIISRV